MERFWQPIALVLCTVVLTLGGAWVSFANSAVDRSDVVGIIDETSPYRDDRGVIEVRLHNLEAGVARIDSRTRRLENSMARIEARLEARRAR